MKRYLWTLEILLFLVAGLLMLFPGRAAPLGLVLLLGQTALRRIRTSHWLPPTAMNLPIILLALTALVGVVVSPDITLSLNRLWVLLLGMATFYTLASLVGEKNQIVQAVILLILLGTGIAIASLVVTDWSAGVLPAPFHLASRFPVIIRLPGSGVPNAAEGANPRVVAGSMAMLVPLSLALGLFGHGKSLRAFGFLATLPLAVPLLLSQSPQAYLGLALGLSLVFTWRSPRSLWIQAPLALLVVGVWLGWHWWLPGPLIARINVGFLARGEIWRRGFLMLRDMPFTGSGLNAFPVVAPFYGLESVILFSHAHNIFLQTANDHGVLGLIAFLVLFATAFRIGWRAWREVPEPNQGTVLLGCVGGVTAYLGYGFLDSMALGNKPALLLWALFGLLAATEKKGAPVLAARLRARWRLASIVGLLAVILLTLPIWSSVLFVNLGNVLLHRAEVNQGSMPALSIEQAERYANQAILLNPADSRSYVLAGLLQLQRKDDQAAVVNLERAVSLEKADPSTHFQLAEAYGRLSRDELALPHWKAAGATQILCQRGIAAKEQGDLSQAEHWLFLAAQLDGQVCRTRQRLAQIYNDLSKQASEQKDWDKAQEYAKLAIVYDPENGWYQAGLGDIYLHQGDFEKALEYYDNTTLKASSPEWLWRSHQLRGRVFIMQKEWELAINEYRTAVEISRQQGVEPKILAQNLALLGQALAGGGYVEDARSVFQQALQLDPTNLFAQQGLIELEPQ